MMPIALDIHSLLFVLILVAVMESLAMGFISLTRKTYAGFGLWTAGNAIHAVAFFCIVMRGIISDVFSVLLANVLIIGAAVCYYEGTLRFRRLAGHKVISTALIVLMAALIFYFRFVDDLIEIRIVAASLIIATAFALVTWSFLYRVPADRRLSYWSTASLFALFSLFMFVRAIVTVYKPGTQTLFAPNVFQVLTFLVPLLLSIPWTFAFVTLNSEQLERELNLEISERITAEDALRKSEKQYRTLIDALPLAVLVEVQGSIAYINPAFMTLFRASSSTDVIGMRLINFLPPELVDTIEQRRRIMSETKQILPSIELNLRCVDGTVITVVSTPMPITFQGQPAILSALYDITERKQGEIELQKAHKLLQIQGNEIKDLRDKLNRPSAPA